MIKQTWLKKKRYELMPFCLAYKQTAKFLLKNGLLDLEKKSYIVEELEI